ncbi:MAG: bifunctional lysine ketoglutarate reductase /saccharopine dehydrogenase family protein [Candidatus Aminicenantales bacterium]
MNQSREKLKMKPRTLIGIRREDKNPWERRTPLIPVHARELMRKYPIEFQIQPSSIRVFSDEDYRREGILVTEDLSACSIILAVKEIPLSFFQERRIYLFFSHTIKGQPHNMPMLKRMMDLGCTLIDYERIVDEQGRRLVFFGRQAGQAGMIDTLWALGQRLRQEGIETPFSFLRKTIDYGSLVEAKESIQRVGWAIHNQGLNPSLVPLVFGFAGYGHVSQGAQEIFDLLPFAEVDPTELQRMFEERRFAENRVYKTVFKEKHLVRPKEAGKPFELQEYYDHPERYEPVLGEYIPYLTVLINAIYWSPRYPRFVTKAFLKKHYRRSTSPRLRVIGDISCDLEGAIECTIKCTNPGQPVFTYHPEKEEAEEGFSGYGPVVVAVDNLPAEISLESSIFFSQTIKPFLPALAAADFSSDFSHCSLPLPLQKAVILFRGELTSEYEYLSEFIPR